MQHTIPSFTTEKAVVYRLFESERVVYVGQSKAIGSRLLAHKQRSMFEFDSYEFEETDEPNEREAELILNLLPMNNVFVPVNKRFLSTRGLMRRGLKQDWDTVSTLLYCTPYPFGLHLYYDARELEQAGLL